MKKMSVILLIAGVFLFCSNGLFAEAIGLKIGYNKMLDDYSDAELEDHISGGIYFDLDTKIIGADFRPGIDFVNLETEHVEIATVYAFHLDFYWFFMHQASFAPFIGFGPALNYVNYDNDNTDDNDSDVGIEGFGGVEFELTGPLKLMAELRLIIHDIADTGTRIFKPSVGISYTF